MSDAGYDIDVKSTIAALGETMASGDGDSPPQGPVDLSGDPEARYHLRGKLGEGGMGQVDWVWDADLMRDLAVKRLRDELRDRPALVRQFLKEARVTASLDHPNVVPVHDLGVSPEGDLYFTMKRVAGLSLAQVIAGLVAGDPDVVERFTLPRRLRVFMQLCHALEFAHSRGVLHRDLKPDNVMLGEHGEVLVMDWGLAADLGDHRERPLSGTPMYMSPEQAACAPDQDERADVFSLGAILYELCALRPPYQAGNVVELLDKVRDGEVRSLRGSATNLSTSMIAVIERAMERDRERRYPSVSALHADVERLVDGRTPEAEGASVATRFARWAVREDRRLGELRPIQIDLIIGGALVAGAGIGALLGSWVRAWAWVAIAGGAALSVPFLYTWIATILRDG